MRETILSCVFVVILADKRNNSVVASLFHDLVKILWVKHTPCLCGYVSVSLRRKSLPWYPVENQDVTVHYADFNLEPDCDTFCIRELI